MHAMSAAMSLGDFCVMRLLSVGFGKDTLSAIDSKTKKMVSYCSEHVDEELKLYCMTCESVICLK